MRGIEILPGVVRDLGITRLDGSRFGTDYDRMAAGMALVNRQASQPPVRPNRRQPATVAADGLLGTFAAEPPRRSRMIANQFADSPTVMPGIAEPIASGPNPYLQNIASAAPGLLGQMPVVNHYTNALRALGLIL